MSGTKSDLRQADMGRLEMYRELQRSVPGLDTTYRLAEALIASHPGASPRVLVVGAGGGREIETFGKRIPDASITAVDPSADNLAMASAVAGPAKNIRFVEGRVEDLRPQDTFDVATSLFVMHHLPDDGAKLSYLRAIRGRLDKRAMFIHADICFDDPNDFGPLAEVYKAHARHVSARTDAAQLELRTVPTLPLVPPDRIRNLFAQAGLAAPREIFRSLWYRCWVSERMSQRD